MQRDRFHRLVLSLVMASISIPLWSGSATAQNVTTVSFSTGNKNLVYPIQGARTSSKYGLRKHPIKKRRIHHHGIDLAAPKSTAIRSIADGVVIYADPHGGYGKFVAIKHSNGITSHYGHCQSIKVGVGQRLKAGQIVATVGSTGLSTGPHLHFEIRRNGKPLNPELIFPDLEN